MSIKSIWELEEFKPLGEVFEARMREFDRRLGYYSGAVYEGLRDKFKAFVGPRLYRGIKPLYLPLARAVDVDAGIVPGGWELPADAPDTWRIALERVLSWSDWDRYGVLYVHYGAVFGESGLKVADLRDAKQTLVQPLDPRTFLLVSNSQYDPIPDLALVVEKRVDAQGEFEYAEVITADTIRTFRNGEPYGFDEREPEYANELQFVPFVQVRHIETGRQYGECTFLKAIAMLDEVNQIASYLGDIIAKHAEAQWAVIGAEASDLVKSGDNVWFIPAGGDAKALVAPIDVAGVLAFVQEIAQNVKDALPELSFDALREKDKIATATLELQLMELVLKIRRIRPNYDAGLAEALRMAGKAAASMGLGEIGVLDDEELMLDPERPVLPLDPQTAISLELQELALERERALGVNEGLTEGGV